MTTTKSSINIDYPSRTWRQIEKWYQTDIGEEMFRSEIPVVQDLLEDCFGYNIVLMGAQASAQVIEKSRIKHKCTLNPLPYEFAKPQSSLKQAPLQHISSLFELLSLKSASVDVVVLFHGIEFSPDPHAILREIERVLVAEGKLIIAGFNPYSLFGLWRYSLNVKQGYQRKGYQSFIPIIPCQSPLISVAKIQDWLCLLGFELDHKEGVFFRPPINNKSLLVKINFMEKTGKRFWPFLSSTYIMMATKRVSTLTPIKPKWSFKKKIVGEVVSETSISHLTLINKNKPQEGSSKTIIRKKYNRESN